MPIDLTETLNAPTPLASALSALSLLAVAAVSFSIVAFLRGRRKSGDEGGIVSKLLGGLGAADRFVISWTSWLTGTRHRRHWVRVVQLGAFFLIMSGLAVLLPWPWGLLPIVAGLVGIFSVFRHYSRHEDEFVFEVLEENRFIQIEGHLQREVVIAVSFLFVFAPVAFAQLQANGYGFDVASEAGPFAFVIYTVIETLKSGALVDYYDLYAERVGYAQITTVENPSSWAKYAIMGYRVSLNLVVLATIKRLIDIGARRSMGLDTRHLVTHLQRPETRQRAVEQLGKHIRSGNRLSQLNVASLLGKFVVKNGRDPKKALDSSNIRATEILSKYGEENLELYPLRTAQQSLEMILGHAEKQGNYPEFGILQMRLGKNFLADDKIAYGDPIERETPSDFSLMRSKAKDSFRLAEQNLPNEQFPVERAQALLMIAQVAVEDPSFGNASEALEACEEIIELMNEQTDQVTVSRALYYKGIMLRPYSEERLWSIDDLKDNEEAFEQSTIALQSHFELSNNSLSNHDLADSHYQLGKSLYFQGRLSERIEHFECAIHHTDECIKRSTREKHSRMLGHAHFLKAQALQELAVLCRAPDHYMDALDNYRASIDTWDNNATLVSFGNLLMKLAVVDENCDFANSAVAAFEAVIASGSGYFFWDDELVELKLADALVFLGVAKREVSILCRAQSVYEGIMGDISEEMRIFPWKESKRGVANCMVKIAQLQSNSDLEAKAKVILDEVEHHELQMQKGLEFVDGKYNVPLSDE